MKSATFVPFDDSHAKTMPFTPDNELELLFDIVTVPTSARDLLSENNLHVNRAIWQ